MRELDEWKFRFRVTTPTPVAHGLMADGLLWDTCIGWAESHRCSIGGGVRPATAKFGYDDTDWRFDFGMYANTGLTAETTAAELWSVIARWCGERGFAVAGGFDAFPPEALDLPPLRG